jgi:glycosyltransferase involved in cell wall biosynthesis
MSSSLFGVNLSGYLASEKGVGEGARCSLRILRQIDVPYTLDAFDDPESSNPDLGLEPFGSQNPYSINLVHVGAKHSPDFANERGAAYFEGRCNVGYWAWELPRFPQRWMSSFQYFDEIWVPSTFCRDAMTPVSPVPVVTVPHCVVAPERAGRPRYLREHFGIAQGTFVFLFVFDFSSQVERKNPKAIIDAFRIAFGGSNQAQLVLKCSRSAAHRAELTRLKAAACGLRVQFIDQVMRREEVDGLMDLADCYVSLHRSEGFGLTMAEAMVRGKPVIATNYSGNTDFMSSANSFPVDYKLVPIRQQFGDYDRGELWAEPDVQHAAALMRTVHEQRDAAAEIGECGRQTILRDLSPAAIGKTVLNRLIGLRDCEQRAVARVNGEATLIADRFRVPQPVERPRCSIVIPVFNKAALTKQCLDGIFQCGANEATFEITLTTA